VETGGTRSAIVRRLRLRAGLAAALVVLATILAGCGVGGRAEQQNLEADPAFVVRVLPTRPGLEIAGPERSVGSQGFDRATLGRAEPALADSAREAGLRDAAVREWTGPDGARLVAVAGLWDDSEPAQAIGGEVARAAVPGGAAWTPAQFGASQGYRSADRRALNVVVGKVSLFVLAEGPIGDDAVLRTVELMRKAAAQQDERGRATGG